MKLKRYFLLSASATVLAHYHQEPLGAIDSQHGPNKESARASAPQIFNALHSVMRQWGSSLNHNGMSFFPATIPQNVDLYHGRHTSEPVSGMEWLAFEIEHGEVFARNRGAARPESVTGTEDRGPHREELSSSEEEAKAALHVYRTKRDLNVLLLDGMSAGKTMMGTLDQQDYVLCNGTAGHFSENANIAENVAAGPPGDYQRATQMCKDFGDKIDGIVRTEAGFELILCDFNSGVDFISATLRSATQARRNRPTSWRDFEYMRGVSYRYHGITAGRVLVDYSHMVSAFFYGINLTNPDSRHSDLPRLVAISEDSRQEIKSAVMSSLSHVKKQHETINWQGVVDLITTRYSDRLRYLVANETSYNHTIAELDFLLDAYTNYTTSSPDMAASISQCAEHYLNPVSSSLATQTDLLLHTAISTVTLRICTTLFEARASLLASNSISATTKAKDSINDLTKYLAWTTWLECGKCAYNEVCFVAIWPMGGIKEHDAPSCVRDDEAGHRKGYWEELPHRGRPGGERPGGGEPGKGGPGEGFRGR